MPLKDYNRIQQVGQGGFGDAYLVEMKSDRNKKFVMKEMAFNSGDEKKDCLAEVDLLQSLNHPNIVAFQESFSTRNTIYLIMEYCSGGDLAQYLKAQNNYLREVQIINWTLQILRALQYLHGRPKPVLHRDMKPANIFITATRSIKIGDFGVSRVLAHVKDLAQTVCGTPLYLAPEIFRQESYDHKCDIWSLGCCVYEMMALKPAVNPLLMATLNIISINPMPNNYDKDFVDIVQRMLSVNAATRPSAADCTNQICGFLKTPQPSPIPGSSSAAASHPTSHHNFPAAAEYDLPVDSLILYRDKLRRDNGPAAAAAPADTADEDLEDGYDCINFDDIEETLTKDVVPIKTAEWNLRQYGYKFNNSGHLIDVNTGNGFKYDVSPRKAENEERYQSIAKAVTDYVYELLEKNLGMQRIYLPLDCEIGEPWTFIYVTPDIFSNASKLLILIGGAGPIRAGIWSRKAVINDSIDAGSQIPLIQEASRNGYAVLCLNQNQTFLEVDGFRVKIRENLDAMQHTLYVWDQVILRNTRVEHIAIMAHTEGTEIATKLATQRKDSFMARVFAVALCHPRRDDLLQSAPKDVVNLFTTKSRTWVASKKPLDAPIKKSPFDAFFGKDKQVEQHSAGDERPEWTAFTSMTPAFEFIKEQYKNRPRP